MGVLSNEEINANENGCYISNNGYDGAIEIVHDYRTPSKNCPKCIELEMKLQVAEMDNE